jgi:hypothetical protein
MSHAPQHHTADQGEKMILAHDPVDGYRPVFYLIFTVSCIYLAYIIITTL